MNKATLKRMIKNSFKAGECKALNVIFPAGESQPTTAILVWKDKTKPFAEQVKVKELLLTWGFSRIQVEASFTSASYSLQVELAKDGQVKVMTVEFIQEDENDG